MFVNEIESFCDWFKLYLNQIKQIRIESNRIILNKQKNAFWIKLKPTSHWNCLILKQCDWINCAQWDTSNILLKESKKGLFWSTLSSWLDCIKLYSVFLLVWTETLSLSLELVKQYAANAWCLVSELCNSDRLCLCNWEFQKHIVYFRV